MEKKTNPKIDDKLMLVPDKSYAITICPDDKHQYLNWNKSDRFEYCQTYLSMVLMKSLKKTQTVYQLFPEISDPNPNNKKGITRWHWHGVITFDLSGIIKYYDYLLNEMKEHNTILIKEIECKETWEQYILKNRNIMQKICEYKKIPYQITEATIMDRLHPRVKESDLYDEVITVEKVQKKGLRITR